MSVLQKGSRGPVVRRLQLLLNSGRLPSPRLRPDGDFGRKTVAAVKAFQKASGLRVDGIVGSKTWEALRQRRAGAATSEPGVAPKWYKIAMAELGVHEYSKKGLHHERILEYHASTSLRAQTDEIAWCSSFVNWVVVQAGYVGTNNALAKSWLDWGIKLHRPRLGAITVIQRKGRKHDRATGSTTGFHVAFLTSFTGSHMRLLGGNQGNRVKYSNFSLASYEVRGYRWPV